MKLKRGSWKIFLAIILIIAVLVFFYFLINKNISEGLATAPTTTAPTAPRTTAPPNKPGAPTNVSATPRDYSAIISFSAPSNDGGGAIIRYEYAVDPRDPTDDNHYRSIPNSKIITSSLVNGVTSRIYVRAVNSVGGGTPSSTTVTPVGQPSQPRNLIATPRDRSATISFTAPNMDGGARIIRYEYAINRSPYKTIPGDNIITNLDNNKQSLIYVRAINSAEVAGDFSSTPVTPFGLPGAPTDVTATPAGNGSATISFTAPIDYEGARNIRFEYSTDTTDVKNYQAIPSDQKITGLTSGRINTIYVRAVNAAGGGPPSSTTVTPVSFNVPGAPISVSATAGNGSATISFSPPNDNGGDAITKYQYTADGSPFKDIPSNQIITGLTNSRRYTIYVRAVNAAGGGTPSSTLVTPSSRLPGEPMSLSAAAGNGSATISFSAPNYNGGSQITKYEYSTDGSSYQAIPGDKIITGLTNDIMKTIYVRAVNAVGGGTPSSTTVTPSSRLPGAPMSLSATAGNGSATISFSAPRNGGNTLRYEYSTDGSSYQAIPGDKIITGLTNGIMKTIYVRAVDFYGGGTPLSTTVTPFEPAPTTKAGMYNTGYIMPVPTTKAGMYNTGMYNTGYIMPVPTTKAGMYNTGYIMPVPTTKADMSNTGMYNTDKKNK